MFTNTSRKTVASIALALVVLLSAAGGAFAAAPSVDTETTNTSQQSDLTANSTQTYNTSTASNFSWSADSDESKLTIIQNGTTLAEYTPTNYSAVDTGTDGTLDKWFYNVSLADDGSDYTGLIADAGANVSLTFRMTNNTSASNPDTTNVTVYFQNGETEAFTRVDDATAEADASSASLFSLSSLSSGFGILSSDDNETGAAKVTKEVGVNSSETDTVTMHVADSDLEDALSETASAASGTTPIGLGTVKVAGKRVPVFAESQDTPDWLNDSATYATVASDGSGVTIHNANESVDDSTVDIKVVGNEAAGFWAQASMLQNYGVSWSNSYTVAWNAQDWNGAPEWTDE